jgi:hypothetical protein
MTIEEITKLVNQFESAVGTAWSYDAKLDCQDNYASSNQLKKCDEYHAKARQLKTDLITAIKELKNATTRYR